MDPSLKVDMKVNTYDRRAVLEKLKRSRDIPEQWRKREIEATYRSAVRAKFEVYSSSRCRNIIGEPKTLGAPLAQGHTHFFLLV